MGCLRPTNYPCAILSAERVASYAQRLLPTFLYRLLLRPRPHHPNSDKYTGMNVAILIQQEAF